MHDIKLSIVMFSHNPIRDLRQSNMMIEVHSVGEKGPCLSPAVKLSLPLFLCQLHFTIVLLYLFSFMSVLASAVQLQLCS